MYTRRICTQSSFPELYSRDVDIKHTLVNCGDTYNTHNHYVRHDKKILFNRLIIKNNMSLMWKVLHPRVGFFIVEFCVFYWPNVAQFTLGC